jgi:hypothetical protein
MASKNHITNPPGYRVETIGSRFALVDWKSGDIKYCPAGTTRTQADRECASINDTGALKTPRDPPSLERRFRKRGDLITFEEIDELDRRSRAMRHPINGPLDPDIYGHLRTSRMLMEQQKKRELIAAVAARLPGSLKAWGAKVAADHGYGGEKRKDCPTEEMLAIVGGVIEDVLVAHFVSAEPAHIKAKYFGIEKRAYLDRVKAAIQRLACRLVVDASDGTNDAIPMEEWERGARRPRSRGSSVMTVLMDSWDEMLALEENSGAPPREDDWEIWSLE